MSIGRCLRKGLTILLIVLGFSDFFWVSYKIQIANKAYALTSHCAHIQDSPECFKYVAIGWLAMLGFILILFPVAVMIDNLYGIEPEDTTSF